MKIRRTTFCSICHGELMFKRWLDSIEKQRRRIDLKERYKQTDRVNDKNSRLLAGAESTDNLLLVADVRHAQGARLYSSVKRRRLQCWTDASCCFCCCVAIHHHSCSRLQQPHHSIRPFSLVMGRSSNVRVTVFRLHTRRVHVRA